MLYNCNSRFRNWKGEKGKFLFQILCASLATYSSTVPGLSYGLFSEQVLLEVSKLLRNVDKLSFTAWRTRSEAWTVSIVGKDPRSSSRSGMESQGGEMPGQSHLLWSLPLQEWEGGGGVSDCCWQELPLSCHSYCLTDTSPQARQVRGHKCCRFQQSSAKGHCLLCLCLRGSSTCRVKLQDKLPIAVHVQVITSQNEECW